MLATTFVRGPHEAMDPERIARMDKVIALTGMANYVLGAGAA
jgi:hypothetical protein